MKICLLIVFNHKYNKNISILRKIYSERFSNIFFLVPFNSEYLVDEIHEKNIINVWESSFEFQGYFAQAFEKLKKEDYDYYIAIGDDQILNPELNEDNIIRELGLERESSYIKEIQNLNECSGMPSSRFYDLIFAFKRNTGVNYKTEIPTYNEAVQKCKKHGISVCKKISWKFLLRNRKGLLNRGNFFRTMFALIINRGINYPYPFFKAYSDMVIINKKSMPLFSHYCGVFAAMNIFVEHAIPLAMLLACDNIKYEKDTKYKGVEFWDDKDAIGIKYNYNLNKLMANFGENILYYHPIKLSKWNWSEE